MPVNRYRGPPMTLANMRENGVRSLSVTCELRAIQVAGRPARAADLGPRTAMSNLPGVRGWGEVMSSFDSTKIALPDMAADQIGRQLRQPVGLLVRQTEFDRDIAAFDESSLAQAPAES
jgi:hypothetical protein